jgi:hypothetical protein
MWYSFGPPSVFFTISPGDECSFRIKLFLNHKMVILPQTNMEQNECIADLLFRSKLRLDNPRACAREYNSIMQIIKEFLIGWNFKLNKQTSLGFFGKVFGWCDTTEEQARYTLYSHILLFIVMFDALVTLLWSNCEKFREEAQKELVEFLKKTMSSTYDLVEEDFIREIPISTSNIQNEGITVHSSENDLVVYPHFEETLIIVEQGQIGKVTCSKKVCRLLPTPVCKNNLLQMRHERTCRVFKGFVVKCAVCGERFTTS